MKELEEYYKKWDEVFVKDQALVNEGIGLGMIPLKDLDNGKEYFGYSKETDKSTWVNDSEGGRFEYDVEKFGYLYSSSLDHPENNEMCSVFIPLKEIKFG